MADEELNLDEIIAGRDPDALIAAVNTLSGELKRVSINRANILREKRELEGRRLEPFQGVEAKVMQDGTVLIPKDVLPAVYTHFKGIAKERNVNLRFDYGAPREDPDVAFPLRFESPDRIYVHSSTIQELQSYRRQKASAQAAMKPLQIFSSYHELPKEALDAAKETKE
jgi:hypothetical protein